MPCTAPPEGSRRRGDGGEATTPVIYLPHFSRRINSGFVKILPRFPRITAHSQSFPKIPFIKNGPGCPKAPPSFSRYPRHMPTPRLHRLRRAARVPGPAASFRPGAFPASPAQRAYPPRAQHQPRRTMSRGMCAADADEVPLPRPERGHLFFRYPPYHLPYRGLPICPCGPRRPRPTGCREPELPLLPVALTSAAPPPQEHRKYTAHRASPCTQRLLS